VKLTKRVVDALAYERKSGAQYLWDDETVGFGVRVYPSGRKSFVVSYRAKGRQRFHTVGRYGELTVQQARDLAREALFRVRQGEDPSGDRLALQQAPTMTDLAERYMEEHARPNKKPSSIANDELFWRRHVLSTLGRTRVADVTREDVTRLHRAKASTPYSANRMLALLSKAFNLAEVWGWRPDNTNPCRHVRRFKERSRERYLSTEELAELARVLAEEERNRTELPSVVPALRLLLFTGCRLGEILKLRWAEVDFQRRCLFLADSKTGSKVVHLNGPALQVLAELRDRSERDPDNPFVIEGKKPGTHLVNLRNPWCRLRQAAGLDGVRLHDLRHSFASVAAMAGMSLPMIGTLLGHTRVETTQRYAHLAADPVREATERIGAEIAAAMSGGPGAEVKPFRPYLVASQTTSSK
jgi:integrase